MAIKDWSTTAAGNSTVGSIDWAEGQAPSTVNDSAREMMAELATFLQGFINVVDYGATGDGSTDDSSAIQNAIDAAETMGGAMVYLPSSSAAYVCNSGLTIDINVVGLEGGGNTLDFSGMTTGTAIAPIQSKAIGLRNSYNTCHPIRNLYLIGPGVAATDVTAIAINDSSIIIFSSGIIENCSFLNFAHDISFQDGAFTWEIRHCTFEVTTGTVTTYSTDMLASANAGERNIFLNCMWTNRDYVFKQTDGDADTYFIGCSFDGSANNVMDIDAGAVYMQNCHIEQNSDTGYYFTVNGANSLLQMTNCELQIQAAKANKSPFYSDSSATNGGIVIQGMRYTQTSTVTTVLIDGAGRATVGNLSVPAATSRSAISSFSNYLAYGGFEDANYTDEWTLANGAIRSAAQKRTDSYSLSFPASTGVTPSANLAISAKPGQYLLGELWYLAPDVTGTSGTFYVQIDWRDAGGNSLGSSALLIATTNVATWTRLQITFDSPAPAGTADVNVLINLFGVASGTPTGYVDDVIIEVV